MNASPGASTNRFFQVLAATIVVVPAVGFAAERSKPGQTVVRETAGVSLVEVPVQVIGRDGKPVRGLTADDFEVDDEGKKQAITAVDVIDLASKREVPGLSTDLPAASRRHLLFLFDLTYANSAEVLRARDAALKFIANGLDPDDLVAVATTSVEQG